ncbi:MAG: aminoglycoside phosphotransferase family protein [Lautropia sp.]
MLTFPAAPPKSKRKHDPMPVAAVKVAVRMLWERIAGVQPRTLADVPRSCESITREWMTLVMCRNHPGAQVTSVRIAGGSDGSHQRRRLLLEYNEAGRAAGLPSSVFTKTLATLVTRMLGGFMGHSRYEMLFYQRVRPSLNIETPQCYHSASDKASLAAIHVLEDLVAAKDASFCDEATELTLEQAQDLVELLADVHGPFQASSRLQGDLAWVVDYPTWFLAGIERVHTDRNCAKAVLRAEHVIPKRLFERRSHIWPATLRALDLYRQGPQTLIHTDTHAANWYITKDGRMGLLDWQLITVGHGSRDVSHALLTFLSTDKRRAWERELLRRYLDRMERHTGTRTDFESNWLAYRRQALHTLTQWTQTLCHPPFQPNSHPDERTYKFLERITTAIDDLDSLDTD